MDTVAHLRLTAKAPVDTEPGVPGFVHLVFGPNLDADNSEWAPEGTQPSFSLSYVTRAELTEDLLVGTPFQLTLERVGESPAEGPAAPLVADTQTSTSGEPPVTPEVDPNGPVLEHDPDAVTGTRRKR